MEFIHFECAQRWLFQKYVLSNETDQVLIYTWTYSECELCNQKMKLNHIINGKKKHLMSLKDKEGSYILFQSIFPDEKERNYLIYIALSSKEEIIIVRFIYFIIKTINIINMITSGEKPFMPYEDR